MKAGFDRYGFNSWRDVTTSRFGPNDKDRLRGLEGVGLDAAAAMLRAEMAATDGHGW
jgi:hypothetical protein